MRVRSAGAATRALALLVVLVLALACGSDDGSPSTEAASAPGDPSVPPPMGGATPSPNFVLLLVDDQGWTGTSLAMHDGVEGSRSDFYRTPHLERLAASGMRFTDGYAPSPVCSPSRLAIQTGQSPAELHLTDLYFGHRWQVRGYQEANRFARLTTPEPSLGIRPEQLTIAEFLKAAHPPYATAHFGKWHIGGGGPGEHGYDVHDGETGIKGGNNSGGDNPKDIFGITQRARAFMRESVSRGRPFYLQLSHYAVHSKSFSLAETLDAYERRTPGIRHFNPGYAAMTEDLDTGLGLLLDEIDELGIAERTYVVFTSDNGPRVRHKLTSNDPLRAGKSSLWEGGVRVPLVVRGPGIAPGSVSETPVVLTDLFATVADLAGLSLPEGLEGGGSWRPIFEAKRKGEVERAVDALVWHYPHYRHRSSPTGHITPHSSIRRGDLKLVWFYESEHGELYDLRSDLGESRDLASDRPEEAASLREQLFARLAEVGAEMPAANPGYDPEADAAQSYVGGDED